MITLCFNHHHLYSDLPWYKIFYRSLDKISDLMLNHQMEVVEPFLKGLYLHPIPNLGVDTVLSIVPSEVDSGHVYSFPLPNPRKLSEIPTDVSCCVYVYMYVCMCVYLCVYLCVYYVCVFMYVCV